MRMFAALALVRRAVLPVGEAVGGAESAAEVGALVSGDPDAPDELVREGRSVLAVELVTETEAESVADPDPEAPPEEPGVAALALACRCAHGQCLS